MLQEIVCKSVFMYSYVSQRLFVRDDEKQHHSSRFNRTRIILAIYIIRLLKLTKILMFAVEKIASCCTGSVKGLKVGCGKACNLSSDQAAACA